MSSILPAPPVRQPFLGPDGDTLSWVWQNWFNTIFNNLGGTFVGAPAVAKYVINTSNASLANAQVLSSLSTGFVKVTTGTGLLTSTGSTTIQTADIGAAQVTAAKLANTTVTAGSYGSATTSPTYTVDAQGRITAAANVTITGTVPGGTAGGDLSGTYPNPTVASINTVALGSTTATSGNILVGSGSQWVTKAVSGDGTLSSTGAITITKTSGVAFATSATTDTTNASNISSGTLGAARLPNPSATTLGGIESLAAVTSKWINTISTSGVPSATQPAESDLSFTDITTNNVSTSKHGFAPKSPNDATKYLDGTGAYSVPAGSGTGTVTSVSVVSANSFAGTVATATTTPAITISANTAIVVAHVNATVNSVTGDGTGYTPIYNTADKDPGSNFNTGTGVFTAPNTGYYQFNVLYDLRNFGAGHTNLDFQLVTTFASYRFDYFNPQGSLSSGIEIGCGSILAYMAAADTAHVTLTVTGSTKTINITGGTISNYITIAQIR